MDRVLSFFCHSQLASSALLAWLLLANASAWAQAPSTASVSGYVRRDTDGNGDPSDPDAPLAGVILRLHSDPNGDGNPADGSILAVTATDISGYYEFSAIPDGTYVIEQVDSPNAISTYDTEGSLSDSLTAVSLSGSDLFDLDFLDFGTQMFAVSGFVFLDGPLNDELFGADDQKIGAVIIRIYADLDADGLVSPADTLISQAATTTIGRYGFGGLVPGRYVVREVDPPGATSVNDSAGSPTDNQAGLTIVQTDVSNINFLDKGIIVSAISGAIRDDADQDGNPADPDQPLVGAQVLLFTDPNGDGNPFDGIAISYSATNLDGRYRFPQLPAGGYVIFFLAPQGATSTWDAQGSPLDGMVGVTLAASDIANRDFLAADSFLGTASGAIYQDGPSLDGDFSLDDPAVGGVQVRLYADLDGDSLVSLEDSEIGSVTSLIGGGISFSRLVYGTYVAQEIPPSGAAFVNDTSGDQDDGQIGFELSDSTFQNLLFLNQGIAIASISGGIRNDLDGDGDPADSDPPLPNVRVTLHTDPNGDGDPADGALLGRVISNAQGLYQFPSLAPGPYLAQATDPLGATSTFDSEGSLSDNKIRVTLSGAAATGRDFLDTGAVLSSISGFVFNDGPLNNGSFSGDDLPLPGVFIRLHADANSNGIADLTDPLITTTATVGDGSYSFTGLPGGDYVILALDPPGTTSLLDAQGLPADNTIAVTLAGAAVTGRNFLDTGATFSRIIGSVRDDNDSDGNPADPDQPLPAVTVRLYIDLFSDGLLTSEDLFLSQTVTNSAGQFVFENLPGGSYLLQQLDPPGGVSTGDSQGANDNLVGIQLTNADNSSAVFLDAYDPTGYLYDAVTGAILSGGSVAVSGPGSVTLVMNGTTGQYAFLTDGTPGTYSLSFTPPPGYLPAPLSPPLGTALDPTGMPNPAALGSSENPASPGFLTSPAGVANPYHLQITLAPGDPRVINNNFPFIRRDSPSFAYWTAATPGAGGSPSADLDGDLSPDLLEYAFDLDPAHGLVSTPRFQVLHHSGSNRFSASYTVRQQGLNDVTIRVQVLPDLAASPAAWTNAQAALTSVSHADGSRTFTLADLEAEPGFSGAEFGFVRFHVSLDADQNGTPEAAASSPVFGWQRRTLPAATASWSLPLIPDPAVALSGAISAVLPSSLDLSASLTGQGAFPASTFAGHYFEILDGPHAGHRLLVDPATSSGTAAGVALTSPLSTLTTLPPTLVGARFTLRPAPSIASAFPPSRFTAGNGTATSDRLYLYSNSTQGFNSYWLFTNSGNPVWVRDADTSLASQNAVLVDPAQGALIRRRSSPLVYTATGIVRSTPFAFRLGAGQSFIATPWPLAESPASRGLTTANGFTGGTLASASNGITTWGPDMTPAASGYLPHYLFKSGSFERWVRQGDSSLADQSSIPLFQPARAVFWRALPDPAPIILPCPWTP